MKRLTKQAAYNFGFETLDQIINAMAWTGNGDANSYSVEFTGTIDVETLKTQFGLTDEDITELPSAMKNGEFDLDAEVNDLFNEYIQHPQDIDTDDYTLTSKEVNVNVLNGEFYIEGSAVVDYEKSEDMNTPVEFNQSTFV